MALVITNGIYYIYFNEDGKHRKTEDISKAIQYDSVNQAKNYMKKAPDKTKGYYIFDTKTKKIVWRHTRRKKRSQGTRKMLYHQFDGRCQLCGKKLTLENMTLDHIIPLDLGGEDELSNIQIACASCNTLKRNILPDDFANRVTNIFMYQMDKKRKGNFMWEISSAILRKII